jgi:hypothetical protein
VPPQHTCGGFPNSRGLLDPAWRYKIVWVRRRVLHAWLALLFKVIMPGPIGFYLAYAMALGMPATPARNEIRLSSSLVEQ